MSDPKILFERRLALGDMWWAVTEFDNSRYLLQLTSPSGDASFNVHFTAQEWFDFQGLIENL